MHYLHRRGAAYSHGKPRQHQIVISPKAALASVQQLRCRSLAANAVAALRLIAYCEEDVEALAAALVAQGVHPGDVYALYGDVGAGKSVFSRAFVRAAAQDPYLPVPSPTFLLQNIYDESCLGEGSTPIHHFDFYRLPAGEQASFARLNLPDSFQHAACLLEWPERLAADQLPPQRLAISIKIVNQANTQQPPNPSQQAEVNQLDREQQPLPQSEQSPTVTRQHANEDGLSSDDTWSAGEEEEEEEEEEDAFTDRRPREVVLQPHGKYWVDRTADLMRLIKEQGL